jgi:uncharacterized protein YjiS (DUF1127 family)
MSRYNGERAAALPGLSGIATVLHAVDGHLVQPILAWHQRRAARRELMVLDDRQLADIGLSRSDIDAAILVPARPLSQRG